MKENMYFFSKFYFIIIIITEILPYLTFYFVTKIARYFVKFQNFLRYKISRN
jgi:hypothetical protein